MIKVTQVRHNSRARDEAIQHFKDVHGDKSNEVSVGIRTEAMQELYDKYYKGRVGIKQYPVLK